LKNKVTVLHVGDAVGDYDNDLLPINAQDFDDKLSLVSWSIALLFFEAKFPPDVQFF